MHLKLQRFRIINLKERKRKKARKRPRSLRSQKRTSLTNMKRTDCNKNKPLSDFYPKPKGRPGYRSVCVPCWKKKCKEWRDKNKEYKSQKDKEYRKQQGEVLLQKKRDWHWKNRNSILEKKRKHYRRNKEEILEKQAKYQKNNIQAKLRLRLRTRIKDAIKNNQKKGSAVQDLGCSIEFLKKYLEGKFQEGMSWSNWGIGKGKKVWHIDHIVPLSSFDLTDIEQFKKAVHYTNLQPLWAEDNFKKGDKYEY